MTLRFRHVVVVAAAAAWLSAPARAQPQQGPDHDHNAHHRDMLTRGAQAMGFDQDRTDHHLLLYADGGTLDVTVKETSDAANLRAVRQHLQKIAGLFKAGDFGKPALTHGQQVPGTVDMARLKDRITYRYRRNASRWTGADCDRQCRSARGCPCVLALPNRGSPDRRFSRRSGIGIRTDDARHGARHDERTSTMPPPWPRWATFTRCS